MVLLESHPNDRRVWLGYLDSVSALDVISDEQLAPCFSIKRMLIDTDYDDPRLTAQLGNVLAKAGEVVSGIELMEHALTIDEDNRRLRLQVADTLAKMGEHQLADKHYQRLMGIIRGGTLDPAAKNNKK
jgi:tetratricopeptide (TPR) repeat protein